jgi:hypothetical protein
MNEISVRQAMKYMTNLRIKDGDILAIQRGTVLANEDSIGKIVAGLEKIGLTKCIVVVVDSFNDLKVLDESKMQQRGWINLDKVRALGKKKMKAEKKAVLQ